MLTEQQKNIIIEKAQERVETDMDMVRRYEAFAGSIAKIFRSIQKIENEEMKKYNLKGAFAQYLIVMDRYPEGITPTELYDVTGKDKAIVSRAVSEMIEKGLITKPNVPGYRVPLFLTDKGKEAARYVSERATLAVKKAAVHIGEKQLDAFYKRLEMLGDNLFELSQNGLEEE